MGQNGRIKQRSNTDIFGPMLNGNKIGSGREDSEKNKAYLKSNKTSTYLCIFNNNLRQVWI
jgi:hypothetical protein